MLLKSSKVLYLKLTFHSLSSRDWHMGSRLWSVRVRPDSARSKADSVAADQYPNCEVTGIDLSPGQPSMSVYWRNLDI